MNRRFCGVLAVLGFSACSSSAPSNEPLVVRVQTWGIGNAGPRTEMVAVEFETSTARVLRGMADPAMPKESYRLSEAATARILDLVAQLNQTPEPSAQAPCILSDEFVGEHSIVAGDGRFAEIRIKTGDSETVYTRYEPFYDKASRIVDLVSGEEEAPPEIVCLPKR